MRPYLAVIGLLALSACASYNYSGAIVRPMGWGGGWGHYGGYGGGWGHTNVAVVNNHSFNGGFYHPGRR